MDPYSGISLIILRGTEGLKSTPGDCATLLLGISVLQSTCSCAGGSFNVQRSTGKVGKALQKKVLPKFSVI